MIFPQSQLTLEELKEFNDLLVGQVRGEAGLTVGLRMAAEGAAPRFRRMLDRLIQDLEQGSSLATALNQQQYVFPQQYRDVIATGERGGNILGPVLESYGNYIEQLILLRERLGRAMLYPMFVLITAYLLFLFVGRFSLSGYEKFREISQMDSIWLYDLLDMIFSTVWSWFWILPAILIAGWIAWIRSNNGQSLNLRGGASLMKLIPGLQRILRLHRLANFTEMMSMMLQQNVPYGDAVVIAAATTGDPQLMSLSRESGSVERTNKELPPFLAWLLQTGQGQGGVVRPLQHASDFYRRKAEVATEWLRLLVPVAFLILIGGGATLLYGMTVFLPFIDLVNHFAWIYL